MEKKMSARQGMSPQEKMKCLCEALSIREELLQTEQEFKEVCRLLRSLPFKRRKLLKKQEELHWKYNGLIEEKSLPLKKIAL